MGVSDTTWAAGLLAIAIFIAAIGTLTTVTTTGRIGITGLPTGDVGATVSSVTTVTVLDDSVTGGTLTNNEGVNLTGANGFHLQNDGTVIVNVDANSTQLWSGTGATGTSSYYQMKCSGNCGTGSLNTFQNVPVNAEAITVIANLTYADATDDAYVDVGLIVPGDEGSGGKSATMTFISSAAA